MAGGGYTVWKPVQPDFDVKIVGGKRVVVWKDDEEKKPKQEKVTPKPSSAPSSNDTDQLTNVWPVLPPITPNTNSLDNLNLRARFNSFTGNLSSQPDENTLRRNVYEALKSYDENQLWAMLNDLQERDLLERGLATPKNLTLIGFKYKLPVGSNMLDILFERFATSQMSGTVDYMRLIHFLMECKDNPPPPPPPPRIPTPQLPRDGFGSGLSNNSYSPDKPSTMPRSMFVERDSARLVLELERELGVEPDLDLFRRRAFELDRDRRGTLSRQQIDELLKITHLNISNGLLTRILNHCDKQGYGMYSITDLMEYLERAQTQSDNFFKPTERKIIRAKTPRVPWGPMPKTTPLLPLPTSRGLESGGSAWNPVQGIYHRRRSTT